MHAVSIRAQQWQGAADVVGPGLDDVVAETAVLAKGVQYPKDGCLRITGRPPEARVDGLMHQPCMGLYARFDGLMHQPCKGLYAYRRHSLVSRSNGGAKATLLKAYTISAHPGTWGLSSRTHRVDVQVRGPQVDSLVEEDAVVSSIAADRKLVADLDIGLVVSLQCKTQFTPNLFSELCLLSCQVIHAAQQHWHWLAVKCVDPEAGNTGRWSCSQ